MMDLIFARLELRSAIIRLKTRLEMDLMEADPESALELSKSLGTLLEAYREVSDGLNTDEIEKEKDRKLFDSCMETVSKIPKIS